jgi:peroxiredoxin
MASARQHKLLEAGSRAPDFHLKRLGGASSKLQDLTADGPVLLAFFKVTCPICQLTLPFLERIHAAGGIPIYGISQNDPEDTTEFNSEFGITFPVLLDEESQEYPVSNAYGISSVPTLFLVEQNGVVSRVIEGWNRKEIEWLGAKTGTAPLREDDDVPAWKAG